MVQLYRVGFVTPHCGHGRRNMVLQTGKWGLLRARIKITGTITGTLILKGLSGSPMTEK